MGGFISEEARTLVRASFFLIFCVVFSLFAVPVNEIPVQAGNDSENDIVFFMFGLFLFYRARRAPHF